MSVCSRLLLCGGVLFEICIVGASIYRTSWSTSGHVLGVDGYGVCFFNVVLVCNLLSCVGHMVDA